LTASSLTTLVATVRQAEDGTQTLNLRLHPEDLGTVDVALEVRHGVVSIELSSASPGAREALSEHLDELRTALSGSGLDLGSLDVTSHGDANRGQPAPAGATAGTLAESDTPAAGPVSPIPSPPTSGVDIRL